VSLLRRPAQPQYGVGPLAGRPEPHDVRTPSVSAPGKPGEYGNGPCPGKKQKQAATPERLAVRLTGRSDVLPLHGFGLRQGVRRTRSGAMAWLPVRAPGRMAEPNERPAPILHRSATAHRAAWSEPGLRDVISRAQDGQTMRIRSSIPISYDTSTESDGGGAANSKQFRPPPHRQFRRAARNGKRSRRHRRLGAGIGDSNMIRFDKVGLGYGGSTGKVTGPEVLHDLSFDIRKACSVGCLAHQVPARHPCCV